MECLKSSFPTRYLFMAASPSPTLFNTAIAEETEWNAVSSKISEIMFGSTVQLRPFTVHFVAAMLKAATQSKDACQPNGCVAKDY